MNEEEKLYKKFFNFLNQDLRKYGFDQWVWNSFLSYNRTEYSYGSYYIFLLGLYLFPLEMSIKYFIPFILLKKEERKRKKEDLTYVYTNIYNYKVKFITEAKKGMYEAANKKSSSRIKPPSGSTAELGMVPGGTDTYGDIPWHISDKEAWFKGTSYVLQTTDILTKVMAGIRKLYKNAPGLDFSGLKKSLGQRFTILANIYDKIYTDIDKFSKDPYEFLNSFISEERKLSGDLYKKYRSKCEETPEKSKLTDEIKKFLIELGYNMSDMNFINACEVLKLWSEKMKELSPSSYYYY